MRSNDGDVTARARIRDAAIRCFGARGFGASVRAVAQDAGVSAGLVIHHFGSKDGLRAACDEHVLRVIREAKYDAFTAGGPAAAVLQLAQVEEYAPVITYTMRTLQAGGQAARDLIDHFVADSEQYLAAGVAAGTLRPSRDERARARYLTLVGFGALLLDAALEEPREGDTPSDYVRRYTERVALPALEVFTEGVMADRSMLDAYLMYVTDPPGHDAVTTPAAASTDPAATPADAPGAGTSTTDEGDPA
ncbi:TetR/AcrR family transcriptional regulator [Cellulomonas bogoriensis]|uniref:TetR family transcriptional regulator n=1 Tax=Cellulomonas bogoriensis 69B4 = DSM 16987 TaxID=1386082 RepID=A0A0A0C0V3_9CELL|nr:TetR family transcriptional regulator [Cellulomonas bogoriensis]KGM13597.1 TetR family transcriptional regulator [Cellulomonas bogoriensis 69B4 = DSM 16987]